MIHYFRWPVIVTGLGLALSAYIGWATVGTISGLLSFLMVGTVLAVLEISLSFDNAIVNANRLRTMDEVWRRRFLTWGILIAVFGMRILFPLLVVTVAAKVSPIEALRIAVSDPDGYSAMIKDAHLSISAFGGTFLMLLALTFFTDEDKDVDWIRPIEGLLRRGGAIFGFETITALVIIGGFTLLIPSDHQIEFLRAASLGIVAFHAVEMLGRALDPDKRTNASAAAGGLGSFLYLEVIDASFSFDGVIGAFALTTNIFLIAVGLGIGAMYVRAMTIMLIERNTLAEFKFLEHGAFYSVFALSIVMFAHSIVHIPEVIAGLVGVSMIAVALVASILENRKTA